MTRRTRIAAAVLAGGLLAGAAPAAAVLTAAPAAATTATCTAGQVPVGTDPIACGGLFFPQLGGSGAPPDGHPLTLTVQSFTWNARFVDEPYSASDIRQDFTVYFVCAVVSGPRTEAAPCGTSGTVKVNPESGEPLFVAEITPEGKHLGGAVNTFGNLCLSVEGVFNGPVVRGRHLLRWRGVARRCDTFGAVFAAGFPDGGLGVTGIVTSPNPWQTWSPVGPVNAAGNFVFANDRLSGGFLNTLLVLDVPGASLVPGQWMLAFPANGGNNQDGALAACNGAAEQVTPGDVSCP